jgi:hypothetical protein
MPVVLLALFFVLLMYDPRRNTSRQVSDISDGSI